MRKSRAICILAALLTVIVLGMLALNDCDRSAADLRGALFLAREVALGHEGARMEITPPSCERVGHWTVTSGSGADTVTWGSGTIRRGTRLEMTPSAAAIVFRSNGSLAEPVKIVVHSTVTTREWTIEVGAATGAVHSSVTRQ